MAQVLVTPDLEYTSAVLTRILSHLVGTLAKTTGVPDLTGLSRRLLREWCDDIVPSAAVIAALPHVDRGGNRHRDDVTPAHTGR